MFYSEPPIQEETQKFHDIELVQRVKRGELDAFNLLVRRYQRRVFSIVHRVVNIPDETEDIAQEIFVTLFRSLTQFRGDCAFSSWVYRIAVNQCKNRLKFLQRRDFHRADELNEISEKKGRWQSSISFADPEQQLIGKQLECQIQRLLSELDEEYRLVLVLRDIEHFSYEEISEITTLPVGTVKSRLHRARAHLKSKMEPFLK